MNYVRRVLLIGCVVALVGPAAPGEGPLVPIESASSSSPVRAAAAPSAAPDAPRPERSWALRPAVYDRCADPLASPRMNRWRPLVHRITGGDRRGFALVMSFIFVESGGSQFAVSRSGCAGLMQFCDATALRCPFDRIFEIDRLRPCRCADRRCHVPATVRRLLETSPRTLHPLVASEFPCELFDARFDPEQAIAAGWAYIGRLARDFDNNVYLVYVGYNAGPHVAARIWRELGPSRARRLAAIGRALRRALVPTFGHRWARRRARALSRVFLPRIGRVYRTYLRSGR